MNYLKHYNLLMSRARNRILEKYKERHHVIPRCMGGENGEVVDLLPEEHFVVHQLLVRIYPNEPKLVYAANTLGNCNNKRYGWLKRRFAKQISMDQSGENHPFWGKKRPEHSKRMKELGIVPPDHTGKKRSKATRKAISKNNAMKSEQHRKTQAAGVAATWKDPEVRARRSAAIKIAMAKWRAERVSIR